MGETSPTVKPKLGNFPLKANFAICYRFLMQFRAALLLAVAAPSPIFASSVEDRINSADAKSIAPFIRGTSAQRRAAVAALSHKSWALSVFEEWNARMAFYRNTGSMAAKCGIRPANWGARLTNAFQAQMAASPSYSRASSAVTSAERLAADGYARWLWTGMGKPSSCSDLAAMPYLRTFDRALANDLPLTAPAERP